MMKRLSSGVDLLVVFRHPTDAYPTIPLLVLRKVTRILEDFVVVANISDLKNRRTIEIVLRRQKTVAAFEALKVVSVFPRSEDAFASSRPPVHRLAPIYLVR